MTVPELHETMRRKIDARDQRIAALEAQVAGLTADKDRLDWLEKRGTLQIELYWRKGYCVDPRGDGKDKHHKTLRAAIDAARKAAE